VPCSDITIVLPYPYSFVIKIVLASEKTKITAQPKFLSTLADMNIPSNTTIKAKPFVAFMSRR